MTLSLDEQRQKDNRRIPWTRPTPHSEHSTLNRPHLSTSLHAMTTGAMKTCAQTPLASTCQIEDFIRTPGHIQLSLHNTFLSPASHSFYLSVMTLIPPQRKALKAALMFAAMRPDASTSLSLPWVSNNTLPVSILVHGSRCRWDRGSWWMTVLMEPAARVIPGCAWFIKAAIFHGLHAHPDGMFPYWWGEMVPRVSESTIHFSNRAASSERWANQ